jgi:hypothetical protein
MCVAASWVQFACDLRLTLGGGLRIMGHLSHAIFCVVAAITQLHKQPVFAMPEEQKIEIINKRQI